MSKVHFIGICGAAMSAVALLLKQRGWSVSGSDEGFYPPISDFLRQAGIPFVTGYAAENILADTQMIVIGKHARLVPELNAEVAAAFASGIRICSFPDVLQELTQASENYVIAGSFGKSTSTALMAWILTQAGKDASYLVGALSPSLAGNSYAGSGPQFVLEGDEYPSANWDPSSKFLHYNADRLLLTSCEHDHFNVFPTLNEYLAPYKKLVAQPRLKSIVACSDGAHVPEVLKSATAPITYYSASDSLANWFAQDISQHGSENTFTLIHDSQSVIGLTTKLLGRHNVQNIVGVSALLLGCNSVTPAELQAGVASFQGVTRRLELKTPTGCVPLYEDFGSSRAKLIAGLQAVRLQYPTRRLHVVFEPHTFSFRSRSALSWYDDMFALADAVYVFEPPLHGAGTNEQLSLQEIVDRITASGVQAQSFTDKNQLPAAIGKLDSTKDVVLVETSGGIGGSIPFLTEYLVEGI